MESLVRRGKIYWVIWVKENSGSSTEMRIVSSMASMLEEPTRENEE
jgi:hypothetical protein